MGRGAIGLSGNTKPRRGWLLFYEDRYANVNDLKG